MYKNIKDGVAYLCWVGAATRGIDGVVRGVSTTPFGGRWLGHRNATFPFLPLAPCKRKQHLAITSDKLLPANITKSTNR